jgi:DNA-directed RNA polymerase subunit RPC12/RpoP
MAPSYKIVETAEGKCIRCRRCGQASSDPEDVKLLRCPSCGYHTVYPAGMGGLLDDERKKPKPPEE